MSQPGSAQYPHRQRLSCFSRGRCGCGSAIHLCQILFKRTCGVVTLPGVIAARSQHPRRIAAVPACRSRSGYGMVFRNRLGRRLGGEEPPVQTCDPHDLDQ